MKIPFFDIRMYKPQIGGKSLVGTSSKNYPLSFGNYFWLNKGPYIINMWAENLEEWSRQNPDIDQIEVTILGYDDNNCLGIITDNRLSGWLNDKPCITGNGWVSIKVLKIASKIMNFGIKNEMCGCEDLDDYPSISMSWESKNPKNKYTCCKCHRFWHEGENLIL